MHTEPAKEIRITFTEEDRLKAEPFTHGQNCLVATALHRMGHKDIWSYVYSHRVDGIMYVCPHTNSTDLHAIPLEVYRYWKEPQPYYGPEVVGKTITLMLQD